jgi:hypothetical protein
VRDELFVIGVTALALALGAIASDILGPERPVQLVAGDRSSPRSKIVPGMMPDSGAVTCHCTGPTMEPDRTLAHPAGQAVRMALVLTNDGDRRRDLLVTSSMLRRRHAATTLTLQPYQLSLSPEGSR